jgi:hypothetical protein
MPLREHAFLIARAADRGLIGETLMIAAPDGSVARRDASRSELVAFEIRDRISKPDIEWTSAIVDGAMKAYDQIDMLIIMSNYEGSDLAARFDGYAASVQTRSVAHIRRYAVVGAPAFAKVMINLPGLVLPVETKTFDLSEKAAAWAWLEDCQTTPTATAPVS